MNILQGMATTNMYAVINTADYNNDCQYSVIVSDFYGLRPLGFDDNDLENVKELKVGEQYASYDYGLTAQIVRLA